MDNKSYSDEYFTNLFKANGDGIYVLYHDTLSRDAAYTIVVKGGEVVSKERNYCFATRNYYTDGSECGIGPYTRKMMDQHPGLKVFTVNMGYYTFPMEWRETDMDRQLREFCGIDAEAIAF